MTRQVKASFNHRNWIRVDITIYQYIRKKLNYTGIWKIGCFPKLTNFSFISWIPVAKLFTFKENVNNIFLEDNKTFLTNYDVTNRKLWYSLNILHCTKMNKMREKYYHGDYYNCWLSNYSPVWVDAGWIYGWFKNSNQKIKHKK